MSFPKVVIEITPDTLPGAEVTTQHYRDVTPTKRRLVSLETLLNSFAGTSKTTSMPWVDLLGLEPRVAIRQQTAEKLDLISAMPTHVRTIKASLREDHVPKEVVVKFPPLVWVAGWRKGALSGAHLFTAPALPISLSDPQLLSPFPWGNIREDGDICWGVNDIATVQRSITNLDALNQWFFHSTTFNDHIVREHGGGFTTFVKWKGGEATALPFTYLGKQVTLATAAKWLDTLL